MTTIGAELRDEGMALADAAADEWWRACAAQAIEALAATGRDFTADDVHNLGVPEPLSGAAWGPRFQAAARAGLIRRVGYTPSRKPAAHTRPVAVWRGCP